MPSPRVLDASDNRLEALPLLAPSLQRLVLSNNRLASMAGLEALRSLKVRACAVRWRPGLGPKRLLTWLGPLAPPEGPPNSKHARRKLRLPNQGQQPCPRPKQSKLDACRLCLPWLPPAPVASA